MLANKATWASTMSSVRFAFSSSQLSSPALRPAERCPHPLVHGPGPLDAAVMPHLCHRPSTGQNVNTVPLQDPPQCAISSVSSLHSHQGAGVKDGAHAAPRL